MTNVSSSKNPSWIGNAVWLASAGLSSCGAPEVGPGPEAQDNSVHTISSCKPLAVSAVKASGNDGNKPENVTDGKLATRWSSLGKGAWIRLDLGSEQTLSSVDIAWYRGDQRRSKFVIQVSDDGTSWSTKLSGKSSGKGTGLESNAASADARYVRIQVDGNTQNDWASITEISVCGGDSGSSTSGGGGSGGGPGGGECGQGPSADKNGVAYVELPGFTYVGAKERFDWKKNFKSDGSMRHDFGNVPDGNQCAVGYFVVDGPNDEELSIKLGGGPHNDDHPEYADTYDIGVTNFAGNKSRLRFEKTHPKYSDSIPGLSFSFGSLKNKWTGVMGCKLNLDGNADGTIDEVRVVAWVDPQGLDAQKKPKNAWTKVFDEEFALEDVELKSPTEPYVATIGKPQLAQATLRNDEQDADSYEYTYIAYRSPIACP